MSRNLREIRSERAALLFTSKGVLISWKVWNQKVLTNKSKELIKIRRWGFDRKIFLLFKLKQKLFQLLLSKKCFRKQFLSFDFKKTFWGDKCVYILWYVHDIIISIFRFSKEYNVNGEWLFVVSFVLVFKDQFSF